VRNSVVIAALVGAETPLRRIMHPPHEKSVAREGHATGNGATGANSNSASGAASSHGNAARHSASAITMGRELARLAVSPRALSVDRGRTSDPTPEPATHG
jgi:hypothetical protein